ncbi:29976_t:CDS:1, partial [Gigaspora margarita]
ESHSLYQIVEGTRCLIRIKHPFAAKNIQWCKTLVTYFKKSHLPNNLLTTKITEKNIIGGGLKTYIDTRWTTVYDMLKSIYQLETCLKE